MKKRDGRLIHEIQKLKEALKTILDLNNINPEFESTYASMAKKVEKSIDFYINEISEEISESESDFSNKDAIKNIEPLLK